MRRHAGALFIRSGTAIETEHRGIGDGVAEGAAADIPRTIAADGIVPQPVTASGQPVDPFPDLVISLVHVEMARQLQQVTARAQQNELHPRVGHQERTTRMDGMMVPSHLAPELDDGDEAVILRLRRSLVAVDMRGVTAIVAHQIVGDGDAVHADIPVRAVVAPRLPRVDDADDAGPLRVTGAAEPAMIGHQARKDLARLAAVIGGSHTHHPQDYTGQNGRL